MIRKDGYLVRKGRRKCVPTTGCTKMMLAASNIYLTKAKDKNK
jgi:hypothetical protein